MACLFGAVLNLNVNLCGLFGMYKRFKKRQIFLGIVRDIVYTQSESFYLTREIVYICRDFAYVARDRVTKRHMCHVFRCDTPARQIANTLRDICEYP